MADPKELSLQEIHAFMVRNGGKVTNHDLVKHFKRFLTNPATQVEARKQFKTFVNVLSTMKNEDSEKLLVLRKKFHNKCPADTSLNVSAQSGNLSAMDSAPSTPLRFGAIDGLAASSPYLTPPPYKPPPPAPQSPQQQMQQQPPSVPVPVPGIVSTDTQSQYRDCVDEFKWALNAFSSAQSGASESGQAPAVAQPLDVPGLPEVPSVLPEKRGAIVVGVERKQSVDSAASVVEPSEECAAPVDGGRDKENEVPAAPVGSKPLGTLEKQISVKEATKKFNLFASEEEVKQVTSPPAKKPMQSQSQSHSERRMDDLSAEQISSHPKSKEWIVSASSGNYQEMAKLASEFPELTKLKFPGLGYTALHFAAKHGNEDIVKLIAGTHKANVNARTNGGYTPLHLAMQFGKDNIFELLCNVYKADRDITDYSGNKPMDYLTHQTTVSASTYSKIKARKKPSSEKDLGFLRIGSINVRVKKTTEAFSNFLGVGSTQTRVPAAVLQPHQHGARPAVGIRSSAPPGQYADKKMHKYWGSADNIPHRQSKSSIADAAGAATSLMPPPKMQHGGVKKHRSKRTTSERHDVGFRSVPTTPNQNRASSAEQHDAQKLATGGGGVGGRGGVLMATESDSDSACGFDTNWKE